MIRAVLEGVIFAHFMHIENLKRAGIFRDKAVLSGGLSNSSVWGQMFADVLNMEVITTKASQVGAMGTAICISVALGIYKDIGEAASVMVKENMHFYPNKERNALYMEKFKRFMELVNLFN